MRTGFYDESFAADDATRAHSLIFAIPAFGVDTDTPADEVRDLLNGLKWLADEVTVCLWLRLPLHASAMRA